LSSPVELIRALAALSEPPAPEHDRIRALLDLPPQPTPAEHTELFSHQVYPYASVYLGGEGMLGGDARGRVAGFWTAVGVDPPEDADHLAGLLSLWASLRARSDAEMDEARARLGEQASEALVFEHLAPWVLVFVEAIRGLQTAAGNADGFYASWANTLERVFLEFTTAQDGLPVHLANAPVLPDPGEEGGEAFLSGLLAPVRSGFVLTRSDLRRLTRDLELGGRIAERKYALRAYLSQDPGGVLEWLAVEADAWTARHRNPCPDVERFWVERAERAAATIRRAAAQAREWVTA